MQLIQAWKDSLKILLPKNLKLFSLVTLKAIVECYKVLLRCCWPLFVFFFGLFLFELWSSSLMPVLNYVFGSPRQNYPFLMSWTWIHFINVLQMLLVFVTCLATRPSVTKKDRYYFVSYIPYFLYIAIYYSIFFVFDIVTTKFPSSFYLIPSGRIVFMLPIYVLFLFFFLDSNKSLTQLKYSLYRSIKMFIYNLPIFFIFIVLIILIGFLNVVVMHSLKHTLWWEGIPLRIYIECLKLIHTTILTPIFICIISNIYIKKLHEQFDVYFTK